MELVVIHTATIGSAPSPTTCSSRSSCACAAPAPPRAPACSRAGGSASGLVSPAAAIKSALSLVARRTAVSILEIRPSRSSISPEEGKLDDACAKSLLRAAERLSPEEIVFVLPYCPKRGRGVTMVLPCFHRAISIELDTRLLRIMPPPAGELPALETLSISGNIVNVTSLLNRCPRLRMLSITFRCVDPGSLEAELAALEAAAALGRRLTLSSLGIEFNEIYRRPSIDGPRFDSLLRAAARLSPEKFLFTSHFTRCLDADLLCFHRTTTSIEMNLYTIRFTQLPAGEFSALERLALNGCTITDPATTIARCPRLRVLKVTVDKSARDVRVHSASLEELELYFERDTECQSIHIVTPLLKQLKIKVHGKTNIGVSVSAPMVENVSWCHTYTSSLPLIFGFWWLQSLRLETKESCKHKDVVLINDEEGVLCSQQLPRVHVLSLDISSYNRMGVEVDFAREMEKLMVTNFSVFELHLNAKGHVFGALVLHLLRMHHIQTNTQKLKIVLPGRFQMSQGSNCLGNCPCDDPKDWRSQSISLTRLEEVEINNFRGEDHEIDFVTSILGWAPMIRRMIIRLAYEQIHHSEIGGGALTIYSICLAYPSLNCSVYLSSGKKLSGPRAWL